MKTIKKILLPTDFSEGAHASAEYAKSLAKAFDASIITFHTVDLLPIYGFVETSWVNEKVIQELNDAAIERLSTFTKSLGSDVPISSFLEVKLESVADSICNFCERENIDLIVIAKHSRKGMTKFLLGSVTDKVVRLSKCPVLSIPMNN